MQAYSDQLGEIWKHTQDYEASEEAALCVSKEVFIHLANWRQME